MRYQGKVQELKSEACLTLVRLPRSPSATVKPFLDAIASPCSYPHQSVGQWVSEWVIDSFRCDAIVSQSFPSLLWAFLLLLVQFLLNTFDICMSQLSVELNYGQWIKELLTVANPKVGKDSTKQNPWTNCERPHSFLATLRSWATGWTGITTLDQLEGACCAQLVGGRHHSLQLTINFTISRNTVHLKEPTLPNLKT